MLNGNEVERVESHKYLGFVFHANKCLARDGVSQLVSAAKKATRSMNHRCVLLPHLGQNVTRQSQQPQEHTTTQDLRFDALA